MAFMLNKGGFCSAAISKRKAIVQLNDNQHCVYEITSLRQQYQQTQLKITAVNLLK